MTHHEATGSRPGVAVGIVAYLSCACSGVLRGLCFKWMLPLNGTLQIHFREACVPVPHPVGQFWRILQGQQVTLV
jgi:hypothetical protein